MHIGEFQLQNPEFLLAPGRVLRIAVAWRHDHGTFTMATLAK